MKKTLSKNKKGFTLVELVVVIAILGILAGIAIPRFIEAAKAGRGAKIVADMRTIESAVNIYYVAHGTYPVDKDTTGFSDIVNGGTWPTPPIGSFTIAHTMGGTSTEPTSGTCDENTAYTYTARDEDDSGDTVTLTDTTALSNCSDTTAPTVMELLTAGTSSNAAYDDTVSNISSLFEIYNAAIASTPWNQYGGNYANVLLNEDQTISDEFLEAYGIVVESTEDLIWYGDYNGANGGTVLFLTTVEQFTSNPWTAVLVVTEDGTVYTSNNTTTIDGITYTDFASIGGAVNGDSDPSNNGTGTDIISTEIGVKLTSSDNFTKETTTLDI